MQDKVFSQMQHAALANWQKTLEAQMTRTMTMFGRAAELETKTQARATDAIEEWTRLMKETLAYQAELSAEWRKLSLESLQKLTAFVPAAVATATGMPSSDAAASSAASSGTAPSGTSERA